MMKWTRFAVLSVGSVLAFALLMDAQAQDQKKRQPFGGLRVADGPLVSKELADKLSLTDDQKSKVDQLNKEFNDKTTDAVAKLKDAREKAVKDKDREALKDLRQQREVLQKTRSDYEAKIKELLKDDQKKTFEEAIKAPAAQGQRLNRNGRPGQGNQPASGNRPGSAGLLSPEVLDKLNLTDEQKKKLEDLRKDFETKSLGILTDEQKKKLDEVKKDTNNSPRRRPLRKDL